jgi:molybdopterin-containing oxidoreductase family iron-sulfur binding subunit
MSKKYWKGLPELTESPEFTQSKKNEFAEALPIGEFLAGKAEEENEKGTSRRDFLKVMGFSTAAVALAACETPVNKAIPYVVKPEEITPGIANWYASTFYDGHDYASVLVKTREGRPILVKGNDLSRVTHGASTARTQASVLSLYDGSRLNGPHVKNNPTTWKNADDAVAQGLALGSAVILSSTIISPSTKAIIATFLTKYPGSRHVTYDAISYAALWKANKNVFGKAVISAYDFSKAKTIVGVACDFLGTWLNPIEFSGQYIKGRKVSRESMDMSRHYQFEANLTLTGSNADYRFMVKPSEYGKVLTALFNEVSSATGNASVNADSKLSIADTTAGVKKAAKELIANKGRSLVVCGSNDEHCQTLTAGINKMLNNLGSTVDNDNYFKLKQADDKEFIDLVADMAAGKVGTLITYNCNPVYTAPSKLNFAAAYTKVKTKVSFAQSMDETAAMADVVCPDHNYLESWGDAEPKRGHYSLQQPTINPVFTAPRHEGTRQAQDSLLKWSGVKTDYLSYLQGFWNNHIFPQQGKYGDFGTFWAHTLHDGVLKVSFYKDLPDAPIQINDSTGKPLMTGVAAVVAEGIATDTVAPVTAKPVANAKAMPAVETTYPTADYSKAASMATASKGSEYELVIYEKISMGNGNQSNNPWLQELPDPMSKVTWDNYITMSPVDVAKNGINEMLRQDIDGSIVELTVNNVTIKVPVYPQPGQTPGTIGLALGYGRTAKDMKVAFDSEKNESVGINAFPFVSVINDTFQNVVYSASFGKPVGTHRFAATQIQHTIMGREEQLLREVSLKEYKNKPKEVWNPMAALPVHGGGKKPVEQIDLWDMHPRMNHKWGMTIDMTSCIGCSACVVACQVENNIAVVGKVEVSKTRSMEWLRIDRYFSSDVSKESAKADGLVDTINMYLDMENPSVNPKVTFQPMLCQHCNHAPCETVCPVLATSHSTEGLNMMTYNRCIGTRYCANNCPFKVRRFNWFNYTGNPDFASNPAQQDLGRMVLNPDVVVRSRGVMEKCTMCVQRIQAGKLVAKANKTPLVDGSIKTSCQEACPTNAIIFGDLNDENSQVSQWRTDDKNFLLLEEIGVKPTVSYLLKVRNQDEAIHHHDDTEHTGTTHDQEEKVHVDHHS